MRLEPLAVAQLDEVIVADFQAPFENITQVWLGGDHYKWRVMRSNGVEEKYITGDAPDREKFQKFAEALPRAIGNPMYHWCHLELKKYFGYEGALNGETAEEVWNLCNEKLKEPGMSVRGLIAQSNVAFVGTTDDPVDSLEWHQKIKEDPSITTVVAPSFRPDKALNIDKAGWKEYIAKLAEVCGCEIKDSAALEGALVGFMKRVGMYFSREALGVTDDKLDAIIADALTYGDTYVAPKTPTEEEMRRMLADAKTRA